MFLGISADAWSYIFIGLLILAGTITQGAIGFGLGTIATPIIALIRPDLLPTLILLLALCISSYTLSRSYRETSWRVVGISSLARIPGSLIGAWAIASLSPDGLSIFIGCAVLFAMTLSSLGWSPRPITFSLEAKALAKKLGGLPVAENPQLDNDTLIVVATDDYQGPSDKEASAQEPEEDKSSQPVGTPGDDFGTAKVSPEIDAGGDGPRCVN